MKSTRSFQNPLDTRLAGPAVTVFHVCTVLALSSGAAFAQAPDTGGDTIAFYYDGAIRLMNEDGTSQRVLRLGMQPAWSPDGTHLVSMCTADDTSNEICLTDVRSGYSMELTNSPFWEVNMWPTFSPDGEKIAYTNNYNIWVMDAADGANKTQLTFLQDYLVTASSFSPDGSRIAFGTLAGDVYVINADGSGGPQVVTYSGADDPHPAWSPDGTKLSYFAWVGGDDGHYEIQYREVSDGTFGITPVTLATLGNFVDGQSWSPDGNELAYGADEQIIVQNLTHDDIVIASGGQPAW